MNLSSKILSILKESEDENLFKPRRVEDRENSRNKTLDKQYSIGTEIDINFVKKSEPFSGEIISEFKSGTYNGEEFPIAKCLITITRDKVNINENYGILECYIYPIDFEEGLKFYIWLYDEPPYFIWKEKYIRKF